MVDFDGAKVSPVDGALLLLLFGFEDWIWLLLLLVVVVEVLGVEDEAQKR